MTHHPNGKGHFRCMRAMLVLFALLLLAPQPVCAGDVGQTQRARASNHGHDHDKDGGELRPAPPDNKPSSDQLAQMAQRRQEALAKAEKIYRTMQLDPTLTSLGLGFDHDGRFFDLGMTLEQALIRVMAGGNRCRIKSNPDGKSDCQLDIITKDKRLMSLKMQPKGDKLLIQSMRLTKLDGDGGIEQSGAKAAFYLMAFMGSR